MRSLLQRIKPILNMPLQIKAGRLESQVNSMVLVAVLLSIIYLAIDIFLRVFYAERFNLIAQMMGGTDHYEIYIRIIVLCLFVIFGSHAQYTINNLKVKEEELKEYRDHLQELVKERTAELEESNRKLTDQVQERVRSEGALRESEEKYRVLVENANDAIFVIQDGEVTFSNPMAEKLARDMEIAVDRRPFFEYIHPDDRAHVLEWYRQRLKQNGAPDICTFKMVNEAKDELWVELNVALIRWEESIAALNFMRDITNQKNLEAQFRQAQRMESVGTLAGGIAHDFNNLLMGIQGNVSVMLMDVDPNQSEYESLKNIERCVKSGANLTRQLLGFARGGKYVTKPIQLNQIVQRTAEIFGRTRREIRIHHRFDKNLQMVNADVNQIEQVLLNLYVNAWQAMPAGGELHLDTKNVQLGMADVRRRPFAVNPGKYVRITVTDTGVGMNAKVQQRIFEPFFTTKEVGKGTGLGLASAYGIVKNHGGFIEVQSAPGKGARFTIFLPAAEQAEIEEVEPAQDAVKGSETILLVDDEAVVLDVGRRMLQSLGYRVLAAEDGLRALEIFENHGDRIDLVVLDMVMPNMNGGQVFDRLRAMSPGIKVLLASGYSLSGEAEEIMRRGCNGFIQKPFNIAQLSRKIRKVLATVCGDVPA